MLRLCAIRLCGQSIENYATSIEIDEIESVLIRLRTQYSSAAPAVCRPSTQQQRIGETMGGCGEASKSQNHTINNSDFACLLRSSSQSTIMPLHVACARLAIGADPALLSFTYRCESYHTLYHQSHIITQPTHKLLVVNVTLA